MEYADTTPMTYGIFSLDSANALAWFDNEAQAFAAAHRIIDADPSVVDSIGLLQFDPRGYPARTLRGKALREAQTFPSEESEVPHHT